MFERQSQLPLAALDGARYRALAYDGCSLYLTVSCACTIVQLDECFQQTACFSTRRAYGAICYDKDEACFWAAADGCLSTVYKLDRCMREIDCIQVCDSKGCPRPITGLSYSCCDHSLLVAFAGEILRVNPACPEKAVCILRAQRACFFGVLSLCPYLLCHCFEDGESSVCIYSHRGELLHRAPLPCDMGLDGAIFWPCVKDFCRCHLLVLRTKGGCYPHLCDYTLTSPALCKSLCHCNYALCRPQPQPEPCGDPCTDVLESVALMEAALAHILNAEGEKIQKVVAESDDVCDILAVNESVHKTLNQAIFLEQLLCCKLENLNDCCKRKRLPFGRRFLFATKRGALSTAKAPRRVRDSYNRV